MFVLSGFERPEIGLRQLNASRLKHEDFALAFKAIGYVNKPDKHGCCLQIVYHTVRSALQGKECVAENGLVRDKFEKFVAHEPRGGLRREMGNCFKMCLNKSRLQE